MEKTLWESTKQFFSPKEQVHKHWYTPVDNFEFASLDFYQRIEKELTARKVPGLSMSRPELSEGGLLSDKRVYLRLKRVRLVFDICAAPFGTSYFFSFRFVELPLGMKPWELVIVLVGLNTIFSILIWLLGIINGISAMIFLLCIGNQIIEEHLKSHKRPGRRPVQLFGSLTFCACGQKMYVFANSPKYICRKCRNKIPVVDLEAIFHEEVKAFFAEPKLIASHLQHATKNLSEKQTLLVAHEREIGKVREEMTRTHRLYLDGQITPQGFGQFYKPAEERLNQLTEELPRLQAEVDFLKVNQLSADDILHEANTLHARWPSLPLDDKRKIAESLVEKITIGDKQIDITFSYLPSSEELCKNQQGLRLG